MGYFDVKILLLLILDTLNIKEIHLRYQTLKKLHFILGLTVFVAVTPSAAKTPEDALASRFRAAEAYIDAQLTKESVPGAAIGMVYDQKLIWSHQFGVESYQTKKPVSDDTMFSIKIV